MSYHRELTFFLYIKRLLFEIELQKKKITKITIHYIELMAYIISRISKIFFKKNMNYL